MTAISHSSLARSALAAGALCGGLAHAVPVNVAVTIQNLAPTNSVSFAPLHLGFNSGVFDSFNIGQVATAPIISVAEGGSGSDWQPAFAAADPGAVRGTLGGALLPGMSNSMSFTVDPVANRFFTFASMVVPSNDFFIGNDSPTQYALFSAGGAQQISSITVRASDIWDAGSEVFDPAAAAFLMIGNNNLRTAQNSVVSLNFGELAGFNGLTTAPGYVFNSGLAANSDVYRISFSVSPVPEPQTLALMLAGLLGIGWLTQRRRASIAG